MNTQCEQKVGHRLSERWRRRTRRLTPDSATIRHSKKEPGMKRTRAIPGLQLRVYPGTALRSVPGSLGYLALRVQGIFPSPSSQVYRITAGDAPKSVKSLFCSILA